MKRFRTCVFRKGFAYVDQLETTCLPIIATFHGITLCTRCNYTYIRVVMFHLL